MLGVFWKIQDICYNKLGTETSKMEEEMSQKMEPKAESGQPL